MDGLARPSSPQIPPGVGVETIICQYTRGNNRVKIIENSRYCDGQNREIFVSEDELDHLIKELQKAKQALASFTFC